MTAVAIDGPAGAGKSTVARAVADALGFAHIDTGAMYRAVALAVLEGGIDPLDELAVSKLADGLEIEVRTDRVTLEGTDVTTAIRAPEVTDASAIVARYARVREAMVALQRRMAESIDIVMEGRDIGSKVLPDAAVKVFLTASLTERTRRRARDLGVETTADLTRLQTAIEERDESDTTRDESPLVRSPGALLIDTTGVPVEEVVRQIVKAVGSAR